MGGRQARALAARVRNVKVSLSRTTTTSNKAAMNDAPNLSRDANPSREERLAAKLRENLRRRKDQARATKSEPANESPDLPKPPPTR
jgi:hypothetical protein